MSTRLISRLTEHPLPSIGRKAANLALLYGHGFRIPETYLVSWAAHERYTAGDPAVLDQVVAELDGLLEAHGVYAVRSSADIEDTAQHSFAGQFCSRLHVGGPAALREAIAAVWESARAPHVHAYMERLPPETPLPRMAVIVQRMILPQLSGVAFSRNPLNGVDETVIEAVPGTGDALVQQGITPERWVWCRGWKTQGADPAQAPLMRRIAEQTCAIAGAFGMPVDLEWVYDGREIYWVQARPMRSNGPTAIYSNTIAREQLPGMIKPLIWSINVPLVNSAWVRVLTEVIGPNRLEPRNLAKQFYYRAYYNMGAFGEIFERLGMPRDALEIMMGAGKSASKQIYMRAHIRMLLLAPRVLSFIIEKLRFAGTIERFLPEAEAEARAIAALPAEHFREDELFAAIDRLKTLVTQVAYCNIIGPLLMQMYSRLLYSRLAPLGVTPEDVELFDDPAVLEPYDPSPHLERLRQRLDALDAGLRERITAGGYAAAAAIPEAHAFCTELDALLARFGHLSASGNDFSAPPWRETPDLVIRMAANHRAPDPQRRRVRCADLPLRGLRRAMLDLLFRRARAFRIYRERISALYTFSYGLFRIFFLALGDHLVTRGLLHRRDDIFYLTEDELRAASSGSEHPQALAELAAQRRREMHDLREIILPDVIYGDTPPAPVVAGCARLQGTPTSSGYYTGRACVIRDLEGFDRLMPGAVLIVPHADVGWTPLFARAGAVVAESGGMLSHSSIIAREYRIPAIVSVPGAGSLPDGALVSVDGFKGEVIVHEG